MIMSILQVGDVTIKVLCLITRLKKHGAPVVSKTLNCGGGKQVLVAMKLDVIMVSLKKSQFISYMYVTISDSRSVCPSLTTACPILLSPQMQSYHKISQ